MIKADPVLAARSQLCPRKGALFFLFAQLFLSLSTSLYCATAAGLDELPQSYDIRFSRITAREGISHTAAQRIIQDRQGFIWIGTQQGLNRYDGYGFEVFNYAPDDPGSISNGWIYDIFEDRDGRIWVATDGGLDLFEAATKSFRHFRHDPEEPSSLPHNSVRAISQTRDGALWVGTRSGLSRWNGDNTFTHFINFDTGQSENRTGVRVMAEDALGRLWIGTHTEGLIRLDPETGEETRFSYLPDAENSIGDRYVRSIMIDPEGPIWIGTRSNGIALVHADDRIEHLVSDENDPSSLSSDRIWKIFRDHQGRVWVGTEAGLNLWRPETGTFTHYTHDTANPYSLSDQLVYEITQDEGNVIWVGTFNGISTWNTEISVFSHVKRDADAASTLSANKVSSFAEAPDGNLWIGTIGGGISYWDIASNTFRVYSSASRQDSEGSGQVETTGRLSDDMIMSLLRDERNRLWAGTMRGGLSRLDVETGIFDNFSYDEGDPQSLSSDAVSSLLRDSQNRIWVATYGGGLNRYVGNGRFDRFPRSDAGKKSFPSHFLVDIEEGLDGKLWLASDGGGVIRFDPETEAVEVMQHTPNDGNSISGNHIICLLQTETALWVGTRDTGLNRYSDGNWKHFNYEEGLPSSAIYGLLEDDDGLVWISHSKGLSSYDPRIGSFTNYNTIHGLQGNDFNNGAYLKTADGKLLFGGANGFNIFYPRSIHVNPYKPPVRLTRFNKFNKEALGDKPAYELDSIQLEYDDYVVGFEFAALDFTDPTKNQYRYMLAGFDREWVSTNGVRQATYTNLNAGSYTFMVEGSNNDGVWSNQGLAIDLQVPPAPWATWWATMIYTLVAIAVVYGTAQTYSVRLHREEQRRYSEQLEALVAERTSALENEITGHKAAQRELSRSLQEKEVLLKEVHHRVKNNMQVISSLLNIQADSVMDKHFQSLLTESQQRIKSMALIHENLYRSDSLLEINFHEYIEMLTNGLLRFYRYDKLAISLELDVVDIFLDIDTAVPCGLIINELVSNALKHAFKDRTGTGKITVRFHQCDNDRAYQIIVSDDGNGIPEGVDLKNSTSMGLEIVRILTEQLDGQWSQQNRGGAEFVIVFPRRK